MYYLCHRFYMSPMKKETPTQQNLSFTETAHLFQVARETVVNWVKEGFLETDDQNRITHESIQRFYRKYAGKIKLHARANKLHKEGVDIEEVSHVILEELKKEAFESSIGDRYEQMLSESYRNKEGIFYTPMHIVDDMLKDVQADGDTMFLDPCCGTGNFLVKALEKGVSPQNLYGFDTDPVAVLIARRRIKEMTGCDAPHVVCSDFLNECPNLSVRFDMVYTNPPWGKKIPKNDRNKLAKCYQSGSSTDTCSFFLFAALSVLKADGLMGLLMPESFFNIKVFENARRAVLKQTILKIKDYGKPFGNMYSAGAIWIRNTESDGLNEVDCLNGPYRYMRVQKSFASMPKCILNYWTSDKEIAYIEQLLQLPYLTLKGHASWGLGIVTGNNATLCKTKRRRNYEPVYRGSDIFPDGLRENSLFLNPREFSRYQQMASLRLLHAPVKLIYRFISNSLVFYCDTNQRYILNSANMLVLDSDFPISSEELAQIMNSPLTNWLFQQLFHTHKVLRGDLEVLPIITDLSVHRSFNLSDFNR